MPHEATLRQALIQTLPLFEMMRMRAATTARRHPGRGFAGSDPAGGLRWVNHFTHTRRFLGPDDREVVSPNNDTLYSNAWLDLADGPVLIESPDMGERYWTLGLLDAWTNPFAYVGRRTTGNRPQRTLVHGPGWQGTVPPDVSTVVAAPGQDVWLIGRILTRRADEADIARVHALQAQLRLVRPDGREAASRLDAQDGLPAAGTPTAAHYVAAVAAALRRNPVPAGESLTWPVAPADLEALLPAVYDELRQQGEGQALGGGWTLPVAVRTHWGQDLLTRARVARNLIGALGVDEAMYPLAQVDADGLPLHGDGAYELRFAPGQQPDVGAFWSLTMYRRSDCLFVANPIDRYSIGDRTPGLRHEADGALVLRLQPGDPGPGHNWLPTPPGEPFYVVLRLYQPGAAHLAYRYTYPPIRRLPLAS
jgi:hypothetical protein